MDLLFSQFEVASIAIAVVVARVITVDGESNWPGRDAAGRRLNDAGGRLLLPESEVRGPGRVRCLRWNALCLSVEALTSTRRGGGPSEPAAVEVFMT